MKTCKGYVNLLAELGLPAAAPEVPSVEIVPGQLVDLAAKIAPTLPGAGIGEVVAAAAALWQSSAGGQSRLLANSRVKVRRTTTLPS